MSITTNLKALPSGDPATAGEPPDPFDLASLCLSQDFTETVGVKKLLTTIPARAQTRKSSCGSTRARITGATSYASISRTTAKPMWCAQKWRRNWSARR